MLVLALFAAPVLAEEKKDGAKKEEPKELTFAELLRVNMQQIFGIKGVWDDTAGTVSFHVTTPQSFEKLFEGQGIATPEDLPPGLRRMMMKHPTAEGDIKNVAVVGYSTGNWKFKHDKYSDYTITFEIRPHDLKAKSDFVLVTNRERRTGDKKKSFIRTSLLRAQAQAVVNGKKDRKRKVKATDEFKGPPNLWLGTEAVTKVTLTFAEGLFTVKLGEDKTFLEFQADDFPMGNWGVQFGKFNFVMSNLVVKAKFDRDWLQTRLDDLSKADELKLPKGFEHVAQRADEKKAKARRKREAKIEL